MGTVLVAVHSVESMIKVLLIVFLFNGPRFSSGVCPRFLAGTAEGDIFVASFRVVPVASIAVTSVVEKEDKSATMTFDEEAGGIVVVAATPLAAAGVSPTATVRLGIPVPSGTASVVVDDIWVSSVRLFVGNFSLRRRFRGPCPCFE